MQSLEGTGAKFSVRSKVTCFHEVQEAAGIHTGVLNVQTTEDLSPLCHRAQMRVDSSSLRRLPKEMNDHSSSTLSSSLFIIAHSTLLNSVCACHVLLFLAGCGIRWFGCSSLAQVTSHGQKESSASERLQDGSSPLRRLCQTTEATPSHCWSGVAAPIRLVRAADCACPQARYRDCSSSSSR